MNDAPTKVAQAHDFAADIIDVESVQAIPAILEVVCRTTGMRFAAVARVTEERWAACATRDDIAFGLQPGGELEVATTICHEIRQTGAAVVIDHVAEDQTYCGHPTPARYGFQSYVSMPIVLPDGSFWGTLCAIDPKPARLSTPATTGMFKAFADLIAAQLDTQQRLKTSTAQRDRQDFQLTLEEALRELSDPVAMMEAATAALGHYLDADQVGFGEIDETQTHVIVHRDWNNGRIASVVGTWRMDDFGPACIARMKTGLTVPISDVRENPLTSAPAVLRAYEGIGTRAMLDVPLVRTGRMVAMLFVHHAVPRTWSEAEVALVEGTCARLWSAVERARAEARLRESEERLRAIFANASVGLSEVDVDGRFRRVNTELCRILGRSEDGLLRLGVVDVTFPEDLPPSFAAVAQAIETGRSVPLDKRYVRPDGTLVWATSSIQPLDDAQGKTGNLLVVTVDISQRKAAEAALRGSEEFNRRVLASSADCIKVLDLDARLEFMSEGGMCVMEVEDFAAIEGACWPDFWRGEHHSEVLAAVEDATQGRTGRFQGFARTMKGSPRWWDVIVTPMAGPDGKPEKLLSISRDVTATKQAEAKLRELNETLEAHVAQRTNELLQAQEALRQSQKMEAVGQLTGGVAHDFNNLLTIIRSSVDFLRRPELPEGRKDRYLNAVSETVDRAAKLTGQLLAFARRQALKPEVFDVGAKVRGIADMLDTVTGARIRVSVHVPDRPCFVRADLSQFETALVNMAVNARDAMDGEGALTLRLVCRSQLPSIRGHAASQSAFAAVSLTDTGSGIAPELLSRIFEPFFTTKDVGKGTGLGLSQVFGFAKQSGGDVDVASGPGEGTTFTLYLPEVTVDAVAAKEQDPEDGRAPAGEGLHVLVVEDNIEVGRFCTQILEDLGYETALSMNAEEALEKLGQDGDGIDIVFSDVVMPGMGGVALAEELRRRLPDLPVVLASGYSHVLAQDDTHGFELLHKPYSAEQLSKVLRQATTRRQCRRT